MINPKLEKACYAVSQWCRDNGIQYDVVVDESDLQGFMLFKRRDSSIMGIAEAISEDIYWSTRKVRGGTILAMSVKAITESQMTTIIAEAGEVAESMTFIEKIKAAFSTVYEPRQPVVESKPETLQDTANRIVAETWPRIGVNESQHVVSSTGMETTNPPGHQRQSYADTDDTLAKKKRVRRRERTPKFESRVAKAFALSDYVPAKGIVFNAKLHEALDGIATSTGQQPTDLFQKFAKALAVLGQQMGGGPLQDVLKKRGIQWKKSDDGQAVILFVINGTTKAAQPIARISSETLEKPNEFEKQLLTMIDFSRGEAPGAFEQKQAEIQAQEKAVRDIARAVGPQEQDNIAAQMNGDPNGAASQMAQMAQPAPAAAAPVAPVAPAAPAAPPQPAQPKPAQAPAPAAPKSGHPDGHPQAPQRSPVARPAKPKF